MMRSTLYTPIRMAQIQNTDSAKSGEEVELRNAILCWEVRGAGGGIKGGKLEHLYQCKQFLKIYFGLI